MEMNMGKIQRETCRASGTCKKEKECAGISGDQ